VSQLLGAAPGLKVLITSRARLRIYDEHEYPVPQLALQEEAVPLFGARARAADPRFRLLSRDVEAVEDVCVRLDCLSLAIELAAARVTEFSPAEMVAVLPRRLDLAGSGPRDLAARQQTLRAAIDWSYQLLPSEEQEVVHWACGVHGWLYRDRSGNGGSKRSTQQERSDLFDRFLER